MIQNPGQSELVSNVSILNAIFLGKHKKTEKKLNSKAQNHLHLKKAPELKNNKNNNINKNAITMMNINVQCLATKINQIQYILKTESNISIMCITEHWMTEDTVKTLNFPNYSVSACYCRTSFTHGGVLILTKNSLTTKTLDLSSYNNEKCIETCAVVIPQLNCIIVAVYHPPNSDNDVFIERMEEIINHIKNTHKIKNLFVIGDFNICINEVSTVKEEFLTTLSEQGLYPIFKQPTRVEGTRCIDNIFVDKFQQVKEAQMVNMHLGDHLAQHASFFLGSEKEKQELIKIRKINFKNIQTLKHVLQNKDWSPIYKKNVDAENSYTLFHTIFMSSYNQAFPEITVKKSTSDIILKWETEKLKKMKNQLDAIHTIIEVTKEDKYKEMYKELKKEFYLQVDQAKREAYQRFINKSENKVSAAWKVVKTETGKATHKKVNKNAPHSQDLNNFFIKAGSLSPDNLKQKNPTNLVQISTTNTMSLGKVNEYEVSKTIGNLKNKETKDIYGVSMKLLKEVEPIITKPICTIINKCLQEGYFPIELKYAKVVPIFKKGDQNICSNYRPVSILPTMSKVFEMIIKEKLMTYLIEENLLTEYQHGYLKQRSTTTALLSVIQEIINSFDQKQFTQIAFCDLSKAFDTVHHQILTQKLEKYGICDRPKKLITSYLQQRQQQVHFNDTISDWKEIERGVPQGSVLGPLLFLIYINDLPQNVPTGSMVLYADDTSFVNRNSNLENLKKTTKMVLEDAQYWFTANNLQLNKEKTNILTFYTRRNNEITGKTMNFLGVTLSETLMWTEHISLLKKKLANSLYCLKVVSKHLPSDETRNVYFAYFHSMATYGIIIWGVSNEIETIFKQQKKAIRTLASLHYKESCRTHFKKLNILTVPSCFILACLEYAYSRKDTIEKNLDTHNYNTRFQNEMLIPYHRTNKSQNNFRYMSIKLYNALPTNLKQINNARIFKSEAKKMLIEGEFYSIEEYYSNFKEEASRHQTIVI